MTEATEPKQATDEGAAMSQVGPKQAKPVPGANNAAFKRRGPAPDATPHVVRKRLFIYGRLYEPGDVIPYAGKVGPSKCLEPVTPPPPAEPVKADPKAKGADGK